ncbi:Uncharacterized protein APZ42_019599 [Daphnia magna]|uniref:Uncharacterized protein n=1 Tax=Daphnia magna TaxID=35525 RepID=A0A164YA55_9CRUS|nr:Uncharacterized protein APZ42_019599 [Daphnia magna]
MTKFLFNLSNSPRKRICKRRKLPTFCLQLLLLRRGLEFKKQEQKKTGRNRWLGYAKGKMARLKAINKSSVSPNNNH